MDKFKEFQGKDLDECIKQSCEYFDCPREKLEIEIIQDAKSGIFGIVGARKAKISARRAQLRDTVENLLGSLQRDNSEAGKAQAKKPEREKKKEKTGAERHVAPKTDARRAGEGSKPQKRKTAKDAPAKDAEGKKQTDISMGRQTAFSPLEEEMRFDAELEEYAESEEDFQERPLEELDAAKLETVAREAVEMLVRPVAGRDVDAQVELGGGVVRVKVDWTGDAGLLIGREGQTLAAIQYLATRMISRGMKAAVRVQLDIGDYRRRQDDKLRELAQNLARKARETGRSFSTRPLSSYHRRIIHLCLQEEPDVQTRSSGEGSLKRVIIFPRRERI